MSRYLECQTCGALPGRPCLQPNGAEACVDHVARATGEPRKHRATVTPIEQPPFVDERPGYFRWRGTWRKA